VEFFARIWGKREKYTYQVSDWTWENFALRAGSHLELPKSLEKSCATYISRWESYIVDPLELMNLTVGLRKIVS
jgi:hypothetical protein